MQMVHRRYFVDIYLEIIIANLLLFKAKNLKEVSKTIAGHCAQEHNSIEYILLPT